MQFSAMLVVGALLAGITSSEASAQSRMIAAFEKADVNHDGVITRAEFVAARNARFTDVDRNGDGVIRRDDFSRLIAFRPKAGILIDEMIAEGDLNHDGVVTRAEYYQAPTTDFDRADTNRDHVIDRAELEAMIARTKARL
ncbi:MAG: EF-hand domain-containing protein [Sphingomonas sp.]|uniref:EF-hand domain-containing protein n=1 Tax=Sphingomonas sp. TaxID=28214 RepID=UPI002601F74C|nr:EF-hand domain-containing protein [Sphingomonas sp.]MDK2768120.1 EF-hand domain-containing protein [Sphingomonas sp.]